MLTRSAIFMMLIPFTISIILVQKVEATTAAEDQVFSEYKLKRAIVSFLDFNSLENLASTNQEFKKIVERMDYFKENREFLTTIQDIKEYLPKLELLAQNKEENDDQIYYLSDTIGQLFWELYPHVQLESQDEKGNGTVPIYNPRSYGNKARDQALAKTMVAKHTEIQEIFSRFLSLGVSPWVENTIITCNLADRESIIAGIVDEKQRNYVREDKDRSWIRNPNISPQEYERLLGIQFFQNGYSTDYGPLNWVLANPVHPDKTIEDCFSKFLETAEVGNGHYDQNRNKDKLKAATGIALNPVAVKKFGERLLNWIMINEEIVLKEETLDDPDHSNFPLTSLMYNSNLPEAVSEKLVDYLLTRLNHYITLRNDENSSRLHQVSKVESFYQYLINFAETAHGSEIILGKLPSILSEPHFKSNFKKLLIESLFKGFDWNQYFKNYSIDSDVKLPAHFSEKVTLAILQWLSQEVPEPDTLFKMVLELMYRGGLNSEAIQKALDLIITHRDLKDQTLLILMLMEYSQLYEAHKQRIRIILEGYPDELKNQILVAIENPKERKSQLRLSFSRRPYSKPRFVLSRTHELFVHSVMFR